MRDNTRALRQAIEHQAVNHPLGNATIPPHRIDLVFMETAISAEETARAAEQMAQAFGTIAEEAGEIVTRLRGKVPA